MSESTTIKARKFYYDKSLLEFASIKFYEIIYKIYKVYPFGNKQDFSK